MKIEKKDERELAERCFTKGDLSLQHENHLFRFFIKISLGTNTQSTSKRSVVRFLHCRGGMMKAVLAEKGERVDIHKGAIHLFSGGNTLNFSLFMENGKVISFADGEMTVYTVDTDRDLITTRSGFRSVYKMEDEENE